MDFKPVIEFCDNINIKYIINAKTSSLNSFKVGGYAPLVIYPDCLCSFCQVLNVLSCNKLKFVVLGNGTNVYFNDYYNGAVIVTKNLNALSVNNNQITALCGSDLTVLSNYALKNSLSGVEFLNGIPGSIGGALYMNASAFGSSTSDCVHSTLVYDLLENTTKEILKNEHLFGPKSSVFSKEKRYVILKTTLDLYIQPPEVIKEKMRDYMAYRIKTQPLNYPSAGSVFIKPKDNYASKLIDEAGLKGFKIGGIEVSKKHAGFFINTENGTAKDINDLIFHVKSVIKEKYNIDLKEEIIFLE